MGRQLDNFDYFEWMVLALVGDECKH